MDKVERNHKLRTKEIDFMDTVSNKQNVNWKSVIVFYVLACLFSWPFFWWRDMEPESWLAWNVPGFVKTGSYMWGPGFAALLCFLIFRKSHIRTITFFGTSFTKSLMFWFIPILALSIFSLEGLEAIAIPIIGFIMILGEELGWRGFLQDALKPLSPYKGYFIIGVMWELWHFTNRMSNGLVVSTFVRVGIFILALTVLSYIMGKLTDKTKSLVIAVTIHAWINILAEYDTTTTFVIFGCSIPFWVYLIWTWNKPITFLFLNKKYKSDNN